MNVGNKIKTYRKNIKMTQEQLAEKIGKKATTIRKYENGDINISYNVLGDIAKALNVSINDLTNQDNHGFSSRIKSRNVSSEYYSKECNNKPINKELIPLDISNQKDLDKIAYDRVLKILVDDKLPNISDDELITYKNSLDYKEELNNQVPLYDKLEPKQLELLYLSKIKDLNTIIENQNKMLKHLENMVESQNNMLKILGGGSGGK